MPSVTLCDSVFQKYHWHRNPILILKHRVTEGTREDLRSNLGRSNLSGMVKPFSVDFFKAALFCKGGVLPPLLQVGGEKHISGLLTVDKMMDSELQKGGVLAKLKDLVAVSISNRVVGMGRVDNVVSVIHSVCRIAGSHKGKRILWVLTLMERSAAMFIKFARPTWT